MPDIFAVGAPQGSVVGLGRDTTLLHILLNNKITIIIKINKSEYFKFRVLPRPIFLLSYLFVYYRAHLSSLFSALRYAELAHNNFEKTRTTLEASYVLTKIMKTLKPTKKEK